MTVTPIASLEEAQQLVTQVLESDPDRSNPKILDSRQYVDAFVFRPYVDAYVGDDESNCVVGTVYRLCGASNDDLTRFEGTKASVVGRQLNIIQHGLDFGPVKEEIGSFLDDIQALADDGLTWGTVLKEAKRQYLL